MSENQNLAKEEIDKLDKFIKDIKNFSPRESMLVLIKSLDSESLERFTKLLEGEAEEYLTKEKQEQINGAIRDLSGFNMQNKLCALRILFGIGLFELDDGPDKDDED